MNHFALDRARCVAALLIALVLATAAPAAEPAPSGTAKNPVAKRGSKERFVRIERDAAGHPLALQTAIVRFESDAPQRKGVVVDLIGAVHIGEKAYYETLNKEFKNYDAVLYELVAPEGTRVAQGAKPAGAISLLQNGFKDLLGLEHQLQYVDYSPENLIHADMSPDDFAKSMKDRGESVASILMRLLASGMAQQAINESAGKSSDAQLLLALFDRNRALRLKQLMAEQFADLEFVVAGIEGPDGSTLLSERNKVALAKLDKQLSQGKLRVAIFYGAGHLPDMAARLVADFNFHETGKHWLTAWNLADDPAPAKAAQSGQSAETAE
jgi:hypothetical protein